MNRAKSEDVANDVGRRLDALGKTKPKYESSIPQTTWVHFGVLAELHHTIGHPHEDSCETTRREPIEVETSFFNISQIVVKRNEISGLQLDFGRIDPSGADARALPGA